MRPFSPVVSVIDYTTLANDALTVLVPSGDREAFRYITQRFGRYLYRIARKVVDDDMAAEDMCRRPSCTPSPVRYVSR